MSFLNSKVITFVIALIVGQVMGLVLLGGVAFAQEPAEVGTQCSVVTVDLLDLPELEPRFPIKGDPGNRDSAYSGSESSKRALPPVWQESKSPCPRWEELEVLMTQP